MREIREALKPWEEAQKAHLAEKTEACDALKTASNDDDRMKASALVWRAARDISGECDHGCGVSEDELCKPQPPGPKFTLCESLWFATTEEDRRAVSAKLKAITLQWRGRKTTARELCQ